MLDMVRSMMSQSYLPLSFRGYTLETVAVSWKSSKQDTVVDSTMEAEYIAASEAAKEAVWIRKFI